MACRMSHNLRGASATGNEPSHCALRRPAPRVMAVAESRWDRGLRPGCCALASCAMKRTRAKIREEAHMVRPVEVRAVARYRIWLRYQDGTEGEVDLSHLAGKGVFASWEQEGVFAGVKLGSHGQLVGCGQLAPAPQIGPSSTRPSDAARK